MTDTPAPVTPRTERDRLFDEVDARFGRNVARFVDARLDAIAGLEKSSTSFEREAAAPAATEALRQALVMIGSDPDVPYQYRRMAKEHAAALASPEPRDRAGEEIADALDYVRRDRPTPDSGLDVERLRQAMILAGWPADGSAATSSIIAAEYARFSEENA